MRRRETICLGCLYLFVVILLTASPAAAETSTAGQQEPTTLSPERFTAIDPVFEALIPVYRKNQAPAMVRRALNELQGKCRALDRRDHLQRALGWDCRSLVSLNRVVLRIRDCGGLAGCARVLARTAQEFARSGTVARRANGVYRRHLRGRCLNSFLTPKGELHLLNRLRFRVGKLAQAFRSRDPLDLFVEQLLWDQLLLEIDDDGPTARESWRAFRTACRPR